MIVNRLADEDDRCSKTDRQPLGDISGFILLVEKNAGCFMHQLYVVVAASLWSSQAALQIYRMPETAATSSHLK